jgi:hypothetical protein
MFKRLTFVFILWLVAAGSASAQSLLSPSEFLGYELGSRFTLHHRIVDYVEHVGRNSDRVRVHYYGETYEGRPLIAAYVSSAENLRDLEGHRSRHMASVERGESLPADAPAIIWLSYNVHGNEASSSEAALATLHRLVSGEDSRTNAWLRESIIILDPNLNPDGRDRYVNWFMQTVGARAEPNPHAREHFEPWPGGRPNHYLFDLNRDWAWLTQQESRHRIAFYNEWMPQIHVDFHEQSVDAPYYFAPAAEPFHEAITDFQRDFQHDLGRNHARYFDANAWLYFTRQRFDLFYPGYGDTWPTFNGAIGMTYEQAGHGRAGVTIVTAERDTLTLHNRIEHHLTTGLSTIETTVRNRTRMHESFARYFADARRGGGRPVDFVIRADEGGQRIRALARLLDAQGIRYGTPAGRVDVRGIGYGGSRTEQSMDVGPGDLVVSTAQPKGVLARVLLEPEAALADSATYDITAWALPYAYGLEAVKTSTSVSTHAFSTPQTARVTGAESPYAYLVAWNGIESARFLGGLLDRGIRARFTTEPIRADGRSWQRGSLIVTRTGNVALGDDFDRIVRDVAVSTGVEATGTTTGFVAEGPDFGSSDLTHLRKVRVATVAGPSVNPNAFGEVWHFFDETLGYPLVVLDERAFNAGRLRDFDVLILPSGSYRDLLTDERVGELRDWIRQGGRLIAMEAAAAFFAGKDGFGLAAAAAPDTVEATQRRFAERERERVSEMVIGSVFEVAMDAGHPLAYGYGDTYYSMKRATSALPLLQNGWNVGVLASGSPVSGFAGARAQSRLENTLVFGHQPMGSGQAIYLVDSPLFRGFWHSGFLLFANAVFMAGAGN